MAKNDVFTLEQVVSMIKYYPETGEFYRIKTGKKAGWMNDGGYVVITLSGIDCRAHRLAHLIMMGKWPENDIDHDNGDRSDNRWCNLRASTRGQNLGNRIILSNNKIGLKGVHVHKQTGKYRAQIRVDGKRIHIGVYDTAEEAHQAYLNKAVELFGEFACNGIR